MLGGTHSLWVTVLPCVSRQLLNSRGIYQARAGHLLPLPAPCLWGQRLSHSRAGSYSAAVVKWNKLLDKPWDIVKGQRGECKHGGEDTVQAVQRPARARLWALLLTYPQGSGLHLVGYKCIVWLEGRRLFWKKAKQFCVLLLNHKAWCYLSARLRGTMARDLSPPPVPSAHSLPLQSGCIPHAEPASLSQPAGMHNDEN